MKTEFYSFIFYFLLLLFILFVGIIWSFDRAAFRLGTKNIIRRRKNAFVVILGLAVGTAMISGSLIMGESMDCIHASQVLKRMYLVDECISFLDSTGKFGFFNYSICEDLKNEISYRNFDGITGEIEIVTSVINTDENIGEPSARIIGIEPTSVYSFGKFYSKNSEINPNILNTSNSDIKNNSLPAFITKSISDPLDAEIGDKLTFFYEGKNISISVVSIIDNVGRANWDSGKNIFLDLSTLQRALGLDSFGLDISQNNRINVIKISNSGDVLEPIEKYQDAEKKLNQILKNEKYQPLYLYESKYSKLAEAHENAKLFKELFYLFASFAIIAAELLIVNIFSLMTSERKSELGMARAIGLKRNSLRRTCIFEGTCYAFFASLIGTFAGIPLSYFMFFLMDSFVYSERIIEYFSYSIFSIVISFSIGFLTTVFTISLVSFQISKLNVIRAIRNRHDGKSSIMHWNRMRTSILGCTLLIFSFILITLGTERKNLSSLIVGSFLFVVSMAILSSIFIDRKSAITLAGIANLILLYLTFISSYEINMETFVLLGFFGILSFLFIIIPNLNFFLNLSSIRRRKRAIFVNYSARHINSYKFRASISIAVFSIIIFTITLMNVVVSSLSFNISQEVERQAAGYELIGKTSPATPIENISNELSAVSLDNNFSSVLSFYLCEVLISNISRTENSNIHSFSYPISYSLIGFDSEFAFSGKFVLYARDPAFSSDREVFESMHTNSSLVVVDRTIAHSNIFEYTSAFSASIGDIIEITINGTKLQKKIVGILDEFIINGIFIWRESLELSLNRTLPSSAFLFDINENSNSDKNIHEVAHSLERKLIKFGLEILVIEHEVKKITNLLRRNYALYAAFMGLGLIMGISGLGLIMTREVRERKKEIGILRAIGFKRKQIVASFAVEASFIIFLGIFIGTIHGINVAAFLWQEKFAPEGFQLVLPLGTIFVMNTFAFLVSMFGMLLPAQTAGSIQPSEAIRAID